MNMGENLKRIRKNKGLTQEQLAKLSNLSKNAIYNYENNKRVPAIDILVEIADALGVDITDLLFEDATINENKILNRKIDDTEYFEKLILNTYNNDRIKTFNIDVVKEICNLLNSDIMQKEFNYSFTDILNDEAYFTLIISSIMGTMENNLIFIKNSNK